MINELEFYLRSVRNCSNNTKVKYIWNFRKIIKICLNNDWLDKNPFSRYEGKVYEIDKEFLTEEEIQKIYARAPGTSARHIYILLFYGLGEKTGQIDQ